MAAPKRQAAAKSQAKAPDDEPDTKPDAAAEATPAAEPETTTDYGRRAGGYVLTEHGWVIPPAEGTDEA